MLSKLPTYCINLKRRKDRKNAMEEQFKKFNSLNVTFIDAVDGCTLDKFPERMGTANKFACLESHKKAVQFAILDDVEYALICEDDVVFHHDLDLLLLSTVLPKKWDMLYLGYFPSELTPETENVRGNIYRMTGQIGAFAYIIRNTIMDKVLTEFNKPNHFTDNKLAEMQKECFAYCVEPFYCYVKEDYSDLSNRIVNYIQIKDKFLR